MELQQLRYFCAIVETGNFSRAAERCHVAQPSLSQQVRKLEKELGGRLLDRLPRAVRLTAMGEVFLPRARAALREVEAATGEVALRQASLAGPLAVGAIPTIAPYWLPPQLAAFAHRYPAAQLNVVEEITSRLLDRLRDGSLDVAVAALPLPPSQREFSTFPVLTEAAFAVLPENHPLANRAQLSLTALRHQRFLLLRDGHCFRDTALAACRRARLRPQIAFESGQFSSILSMVSAGLGISIIPAMAREPRAGCRFIPISDIGASRTIGLVTLKSRSLSRIQSAFLKQIQTNSKPLEAK